MVARKERVGHPMTITEVKRHLDGREERFECELLVKRGDLALVRFAFHQDEPHADGPFRLPAGEVVTLAAFWADRPYLVYRLIDGDGQLIGHRFDVCTDVRIDDEIHYTDLVLDVWMPPDGSVHVLDEDEVAEAEATGVMSPQQRTVVEQAKRYLLRHADDVAGELDALAAQAGVAEHAD